MDYYKIASGEINFPLIKDICKNAKKVILSTGMSNYEEAKTINFILNNKIKKYSSSSLQYRISYLLRTLI